MTDNRAKLLRYAFLLQLPVGLIFMALFYPMGKVHFDLIRKGLRAPGKIVDYKEEYFKSTSGSSSTSFMPIVEFRAGDRVIRFEDWMGSNSTGGMSGPVTVLYSPADPSVAMIDRPVWNWIPWAPTFVLGLFLVLVAIKGAFRSLG